MIASTVTLEQLSVTHLRIFKLHYFEKHNFTYSFFYNTASTLYFSNGAKLAYTVNVFETVLKYRTGNSLICFLSESLVFYPKISEQAIRSKK